MDPTSTTNVTVAIIVVLGSIITALISALVAVLNGRKEKRSSTESGVDKSLREGNEILTARITLRDEQIADLERDLARKNAEFDELHDLYRLVRDQLRAEAAEAERQHDDRP